MAEVRLRNVKKSFGAVQVLKGIDLDIANGEFVVFVGPSGCGKSTLLRLIAGLEEISEGTLEIDGKIANNIPPAGRGISMVFQSYALYPHMTVGQNMAFGLKLAGVPKAEREQRVRRAASMLQLDAYLDRLPRQLSGGQRQRVAIGRAITRDPKVFLFDEPLSNLDAALRVATRVEIANLKDALPGTTMIYVTHDQTEALTLADRIVVLNAGRIEQVGTPMELYHKPANTFVAQFIGSPAMNMIPSRLAAGHVHFADGRSVAMLDYSSAGDATVQFGVRPEHLRQVGEEEATFFGTITNLERLGEHAIAHIDIGGDTMMAAKLANESQVAKGSHIGLGFDPDRALLFDGNGVRIAA
ncbi:alpha-glucoside ABC transporter, ATP-binding protein (plasmid) [Ensifer adhaerens OV14]|nr:alpha-glucoside ABC transporter, ATP-binding protein [Ensifer adhaerens OV14]